MVLLLMVLMVMSALKIRSCRARVGAIQSMYQVHIHTERWWETRRGNAGRR